MDLTVRERVLLEQARRNPDSREGQGKVLLGIALVMLAAGVAEAWFDDRAGGWSRISFALVWLMFGTSTWNHLRFESVAFTLIAKLDGSYADRVPPQPSALGLGPDSGSQTGPRG